MQAYISSWRSRVERSGRRSEVTAPNWKVPAVAAGFAKSPYLLNRRPCKDLQQTRKVGPDVEDSWASRTSQWRPGSGWELRSETGAAVAKTAIVEGVGAGPLKFGT